MKALPALDALEDQEVRAAGGELDVRRADHRTAVQVRGELHMVDFSQRGDLLGLQNAADPAEVHLQDRRGAGAQHPREIVLGGEPLAGGDRDARSRAPRVAISSGASGGTGSSNHSGS